MRACLCMVRNLCPAFPALKERHGLPRVGVFEQLPVRPLLTQHPSVVQTEVSLFNGPPRRSKLVS